MHDICVGHEEWRSFTVQDTPQSRYGNAYYHVNIACIQSQWPLFHPSELIIMPENYNWDRTLEIAW